MTPTLHVDTFKQGLLSRLGHDLRLRAERFDFELDAGTVRGRVDLASLRVVGAVRDGRVDQATPSDSDKAQIERTIASEVLELSRFGSEAVLTGTASATAPDVFTVRGTLALHGRTEAVSATVERRGDVLRARLELVPSRFGIAPYRALGGTLRLQDRVSIQIELPVAAVAPDLARPADARARWTAT